MVTHHSHHAKGSQWTRLKHKSHVKNIENTTKTLIWGLNRQNIAAAAACYLSACHTVWLNLGSESERIHGEWSKHRPHLLPVGSKRIPARKQFSESLSSAAWTGFKTGQINTRQKKSNKLSDIYRCFQVLISQPSQFQHLESHD